MSGIEEVIRAQREAYMDYRAHIRLQCAMRLYDEVMETVQRGEVFDVLHVGTPILDRSTLESEYHRFETAADLKFFKEFIERGSENAITCRIGFGIFSLLKCGLKD